MIKLDRKGVKVPGTWSDQVRKIFPDEALFQKKSLEFESLGIDDPVRRQGFKSYAPNALPRTKRGKCDFKALWGKAKKALAVMSHQKCAYCEHPINAGRCAAVEHFKPKSLFPSLAYDWLNYFLGCFGCNGAKGDKWPAGGAEYIRPDDGDPSAEFVFLEDGSVHAAVPGSAADHTIRDLDLDGKWLRELRRRAIEEMLRELDNVLKEPGLSEEVQERLARRQYERLQNPELGYSEALRQCFRRAWCAKLPTAFL
jgi:uncharacterized protein (TIGR02646 family)